MFEKLRKKKAAKAAKATKPVPASVPASERGKSKPPPPITEASQPFQDKVGALTSIQRIDQLLAGGLHPGESSFHVHQGRQFLGALFRQTNEELEAMNEFATYFPQQAGRKAQQLAQAAELAAKVAAEAAAKAAELQ